MNYLLIRGSMFLVLFLNLIHPLIHGTPLDGGVLDSLLQGLNVWAFQLGQLGAVDD